MSKLYFLFLLLFPLRLFAQSSSPEPYIINSDTSGFQLLPTRFWQMIEDTSGAKWNIGQVSNVPLANAFHKNTTDIKFAGFPVNTYWIRFKLKTTLAVK